MQDKDIFSPTGGLSIIRAGGRARPYIALSVSGGRGRKAGDILAVAPATSVTVDDSTDHMESRTLGGDFAVAVMGYRLVPIVISGLDPYSVCIYDGMSWHSNTGIADFYNRYNVQASPRARVSVVCGPSTYKCVITELSRSSQGSFNGVDGIGNYKLTLLGVKLR